MLADDGRVVSNFIVQALEGKDLTLYGDGEQTRSFCFVSDLIEAFVRAMTQEETVGPINVGNPDEFTIRELAEKVIEKTGGESAIVKKPLPADDPMRRRPDIELAKKIMDWEPSVSLDQGLDQTIAYFRQQVGQA